MIAVLVTGMSGVGESTVLLELARRGHRVIDTDYGGWSEDIVSVEGTGVEQLWREDRMSDLLAQDSVGVLFISGTVANQGSSTTASTPWCRSDAPSTST